MPDWARNARDFGIIVRNRDWQICLIQFEMHADRVNSLYSAPKVSLLSGLDKGEPLILKEE